MTKKHKDGLTRRVKFIKQVEELLTKSQTALRKVPPETLRNLLEDLHIYHNALEEQNEKLLKIKTELEESRNNYMNLYDFAPVGYVTLDEKGNIHDANLTITKKLLVEEKNHMFHNSLSSFLLPESQEIFSEHLKKVFETGLRQHCELKFLKKDNSILYAQLNSIPFENIADNSLRCFMSITDISEQKHFEEILKERDNLRKKMFESSPDGIIVTTIDGNIIDANPAFQKMLGYSLQELKDITYRNITGEEWHEQEAQAVSMIMKKGAGIFEKEYIRKDGSVFPVCVTKWAISNEEGYPHLFVGFVKENTARFTN